MRKIEGVPDFTLFKPAGIPTTKLDLIVLSLDEVEAIRLVDLQGMYQEEAADRMNVSRRTFGRVIESAHKKVALALVQGKALRIEGGPVEMHQQHAYECATCQHQWSIPCAEGEPAECPKCQSGEIHRTDTCCGSGAKAHRHGGGQGRGPCCKR